MHKKALLLAKLRQLALSGDAESTHSEADEALVEFINDPEIAAAYHAVKKWYA